MAGCSYCEKGVICVGKQMVALRVAREASVDLFEASKITKLGLEGMKRVESPLPGDDDMLQRLNASIVYLNLREPVLSDLQRLLKTDPSWSYNPGWIQPLKCRPATEGYIGQSLADKQEGCTYHSDVVFLGLDAIKRS